MPLFLVVVVAVGVGVRLLDLAIVGVAAPPRTFRARLFGGWRGGGGKDPSITVGLLCTSPTINDNIQATIPKRSVFYRRSAAVRQVK